jgi:hypothetical protein
MSGEVLMVIPGTSLLMMLFGTILMASEIAGRSKMLLWEKIVFTVFAVTGIGLFPSLLLLGV